MARIDLFDKRPFWYKETRFAVAVYRVTRQTVVIVRFVHGARDLHPLFGRP